MNATDNRCPTCGADGHSCTGGAMTDSRMIITNDGARKVTGPLRLPRQKNTIGRAGYVGRVETYDPKHPDVVLVQDDDDLEGDEEAADEAQAAAPQDATLEAVKGAPAPAEAESEGTATVAEAAPAKQRKPAPEDKSRKGGTGTKK